MSCQDLLSALDDISAALACVCTQLVGMSLDGQPPDPGYEGQRYYDDYLSPVVYGQGDPPIGFATWQEWRDYKCVAGQRLVDDLKKVVYVLAVLIDEGTKLSFSLVNEVLLDGVVEAPVVVVVEAILALIAALLEIDPVAIAAWLEEHKQALVCIWYAKDTSGEAYSATQDYLDAEWDAGVGKYLMDVLLCRQTFSSMFDGTMRLYSLWAGSYSPSYCADCIPPGGMEYQFDWPPCPNGYFLDSGVCWNTRLCFNGTMAHAHQEWQVPEPVNRLTSRFEWYSSRAAFTVVGQFNLDNWNPATEQWVENTYIVFLNNVAAGQLNVLTPTTTLVVAKIYSDKWRLRIVPFTGWTESEPYPLMLQQIKGTWWHT